jgi:hypothetical protein
MAELRQGVPLPLLRLPHLRSQLQPSLYAKMLFSQMPSGTFLRPPPS